MEFCQSGHCAVLTPRTMLHKIEFSRIGSYLYSAIPRQHSRGWSIHLHRVSHSENKVILNRRTKHSPFPKVFIRSEKNT